MDAHKKIRRICNVGIGILFPCFVICLIWFLTGSLEMNPTPEQMEKARLTAGAFAMLTGIPCVICIIYRIKFRK